MAASGSPNLNARSLKDAVLSIVTQEELQVQKIPIMQFQNVSS